MFKKLIFIALITLFGSSLAYAFENIMIIPSYDGFVSKNRIINLVIKIDNERKIDTANVFIHWNGQDITKEIIDTAVLQKNDDELIFYYPMAASVLTPGIHLINTYAGVEQHQYELTVEDFDNSQIKINFTETPPINESNSLSSASTATPSISSFSGSKWSYSCSNSTFNNYFQVAYEGYTTIPLYVNGSGLDKITSIDIIGDNYKTQVSILSKSSTQLKLGIIASKNGWSDSSPKPTAKPKLRFYGKDVYLEKNIDTGVIPTFYVNNQAWGQCTWFAGLVMRLRNGQTPVSGYSGTVTLSGDPSSSGFPKNGSVLNCSDKHMAYLENISSKTVKNSDGSTTTTYTLTGSQYNADCKASKSSFSTTNNDNQMIVKKSKDGKYSITKYPKVVYQVTKIKQ
ncbi:MAG: hypothetical protein WCJ49_00035 [Deltaproteobacteria bacterium]